MLKQKQMPIMKKEKNKLLLVLFLLCFSINTSAQIKVTSHINIRSNIERPYLEVSLQYSNKSDSCYVIWLQNWRFTPLLHDSSLFHGMPTETNRVNFLFLLSEGIDIFSHFNDNEEYSNISYELYNCSIKILKQNQVFIENIRIYDPVIIDYVKKNKFNIAIIYSTASFEKLDSIAHILKNKLKFYPLSTLNIFEMPSIYTNSALDVNSYNFKCNNLKSFKVDMLEVNRVFKKFIYNSKGSNTLF